MSKTALFKEINKEIKKLNNRIDSKIVRGRSYEKEARRHRELLATMQRINHDAQSSKFTSRRRSRAGKSPVRRSLKRGVVARIFTRKFAC